MLQNLLAGLTLAAITIPEQMATARLGGFEPQIGFYAFIGATVGFALVGASRLLTAGADSTITPVFATILAAVGASLGGHGLQSAAVTLALLVAIVLLIAGALRLGWIADLLSTPIVTGFLAGIAVHIAVSQLPDALGLRPTPGNFFVQVAGLAQQADHINPWSLALAAGVLVVTTVSEKLDPRIPGALIAVALATGATMTLGLEQHGVAVLGALPAGLPTPVLPTFGLDALRELVPLAVLVALVIMMQTATVSRSFASKDNPPDVNRDYLGLGVANLGAALLCSFPVNASPPRTAVVREAGGRSKAATLAAAVLVALLTLGGGGLLAQVPHAALAGILLFVALRIVRTREIAAVLRQAPGEAALIALTAIAVIALPIPTGVAAGVGFSLLHGVWITTQTKVAEYRRMPGTTIWWPAGARVGDKTADGETVAGVLVAGFQAPLLFANAETFAHGLRAALARHPGTRLMVLEASGIADIDYTAAQALKGFIERCRAQGIDFAISRLGSARAERAMEKFGVIAELGEHRVFHSVAEAIDGVRAGGS